MTHSWDLYTYFTLWGQYGDYMKSKCTYLIAVRNSRQSLITGEKCGRERINLEINSNTC